MYAFKKYYCIFSDIKPIIQTNLYVSVRDTQWPIIYSPEYNIGFLGLEKLHPFDAGKWGKVFQFLKGNCILIGYNIMFSMRCLLDPCCIFKRCIGQVIVLLIRLEVLQTVHVYCSWFAHVLCTVSRQKESRTKGHIYGCIVEKSSSNNNLTIAYLTYNQWNAVYCQLQNNISEILSTSYAVLVYNLKVQFTCMFTQMYQFVYCKIYRQNVQ